jgi:hypothetical protein
VTTISLPRADELVYRVDPNLTAAITVKNHLNRQSPPPANLEKVSITKLVNPGQAYYDVVNPLPEEIGAFQKRMAGTGAHDKIEKILELPAEYWLDGKDVPGEPALDRITGKLDSVVPLPDGRFVPVEIKNVNNPRTRLPTSYLEQLGMYCAMLQSDHGLILRVFRDDATGHSTLLTPVEVTYPDLNMIRKEMVARRDLLTEAVRNRDPSKLPACSWVGYKCKYKEAGICTCEERSQMDPVIARGATTKESPEFLATVEKHEEEREAKLAERGPSDRLSLYQFLIPRKLYFDRITPAEKEDEGEADVEGEDGGKAEVQKAVSKVNTEGLKIQVNTAVRGANRSRLAVADATLPALKGSHLQMLDGSPFMVKIRMVNNAIRPTAAEITGQWGVPEDIRLLAFQAAILNAQGGRIYVWNWKLKEEAQKLQVFDIKFAVDKLDAVRSYLKDLPEMLKEAVAKGDHKALPQCPSWMCEKCVFKERCKPELP